MKIAITVSDFGAQLHTGADIERITWVIDVPEERIPPELQVNLQQVLNPKPGSHTPHFTISLSLLKE